MKARIAERIQAALEKQRPAVVSPQAHERHYTASEIAEMWRLDASTVRRLFRDVPGVLKIGERGVRRGRQREHLTIRVPESVLHRFHRERIL
jgi:hypothetical protein